MSNSNKKVREEAERRYGKKCMLHEGLNIKGYKYSKCRYKGTAIREQLSLHHIKPRRENGETSVRNSAVLCRGCHDFVEQVSEAQRQQLNNALQEYKRKIDEARECKIELVDTLDIGIEIKMAEISFSDEIKPPKEKFNRAEIKRETRNKIRDWEERKMITTETRYESYKEIIDKKKLRYNQILDRLDRPKTAKQIAVELFELGLIPSTERNYTAPRLTELVDVGIVAVVGKTKCEYTGKQVALYKQGV